MPCKGAMYSSNLYTLPARDHNRRVAQKENLKKTVYTI